MATQDEERKASTASAPNYGLTSEDDAAVLGRSRYQGLREHVSDTGPSKTWVQARVAAELHYDRSLRHCLQYNGTLTIHCFDTVILYSRWSCGNGLG